MLRILHDTNYDFIKSWRIALGATIAFIAIGFIALGIHGGLNRSIEFTGGTLVQAEFAKKPDVGELRSTVDAAGFKGAEIQQFGSDTSFTIRAAGHQTAAVESDHHGLIPLDLVLPCRESIATSGRGP